jgi:hypothetical protein
LRSERHPVEFRRVELQELPPRRRTVRGPRARIRSTPGNVTVLRSTQGKKEATFDPFPRGGEGYGWRPIPDRLSHLPVSVVDLDGTLRGDVIPMVKLAAPLVPNFLAKVTFREPLNAHKLVRFLWNMGGLWTLRIIYYEHRRRYKHLFSELHNLAAALLAGMELEVIRAKFRQHLPAVKGLWFEHSAELLKRLTDSGLVVLVTGSEQLQTEESVRLLAGLGVDVDRIFVRGSLYGFHPRTERFTGKVRHLNVTLEGKRDALQLSLPEQARVRAAVGNSRPDRALFERVTTDGLCLLVCPTSVIERRKDKTFVVRKLRHSGYRVHWDVSSLLAASSRYVSGQDTYRPILAVDPTFGAAMESPELQSHHPWLQPAQHDPAPQAADQLQEH